MVADPAGGRGQRHGAGHYHCRRGGHPARGAGLSSLCLLGLPPPGEQRAGGDMSRGPVDARLFRLSRPAVGPIGLLTALALLSAALPVATELAGDLLVVQVLFASAGAMGTALVMLCGLLDLLALIYCM